MARSITKDLRLDFHQTTLSHTFASIEETKTHEDYLLEFIDIQVVQEEVSYEIKEMTIIITISTKSAWDFFVLDHHLTCLLEDCMADFGI